MIRFDVFVERTGTKVQLISIHLFFCLIIFTKVINNTLKHTNNDTHTKETLTDSRTSTRIGD